MTWTTDLILTAFGVIVAWGGSLWAIYTYLDRKMVKLRADLDALRTTAVEREHVERSIEKLEIAIVKGLDALRLDLGRTHDRIDKLMGELVAERREGR